LSERRHRAEHGAARAGHGQTSWLYALGTAGYAVDDPGLDEGFAGRVMYFFDKTFKYKHTIAGF
jgi:hypothetical protein